MSSQQVKIFECDLCRNRTEASLSESIPDDWITVALYNEKGTRRVYDICYTCAETIHVAAVEAGVLKDRS